LWAATILSVALVVENHQEIRMGIPLGIVGLIWGYKWLNFISYELSVNKSHVTWGTSAIETNRTKVALRNIETVQVHQTLMGRLLGYGTILLHGNGRGLGRLELIADPYRFASAIEDAQMV
jgi:hypothetical protein